MQIIDERDMTLDLDQRIRHSLCRCFPKDDPVFSQTRAWHGSAPAYSVLVREADQVIAHVGVVHRRIKIADQFLEIGGVQNVLVLPEFRGRGLVDQVMAASMQEAAKRGYDGGLLFCIPELEKVYRRCGWIGVGEREVIRVEAGQELPLPGRNLAMFYPLRRKDFPAGIIHLQGNDW